MKRKPREIRLEPLEAKLNDYELKFGGRLYSIKSIVCTKEELKRIYELIGNERGIL